MNDKIKRFFDIVGALLGMLILFPIFLLISIIQIRFVGAPIFFKQERIGRGGRPFQIYKFRTMVINNEENGLPLLAEDGDDRLTKIGSFLRKYHLDELPQLWNVLIGDMSFVGYRPERKYFIDKIMERRPDYAKLYSIRPGITSMATIYNGYTFTLDKMIRRLDMDLDYLSNRSLVLDFKIIFLTIASIVSGKKI
mgnify:FL=1